MYLTKEEERILDGEEGEAKSLAMKTVVKVGEALGAKRLVKIKNAHISGISYKNIGDAGLEFLEELVKKGARVSVPTTINPAGFDTKQWKKMNVDSEFYQKQMKVIQAFISMGVKPTLTCTPYLYTKLSLGDHIAWAESNAVLYANSVIGARTNRDGGPLALFEAIAGRAPYVGLHLDEGRVPEVLIDFENIRDILSKKKLYQVAGYIVGKIAGNRVALVRNSGLNMNMQDQVKLFLAAVGAAGGTGMVVLPGISPEYKEKFDDEVSERVSVDETELKGILEMYGYREPEVVVIGCPHLSLDEINSIVEEISRKRGAKKRLLLFTARWNESSLMKFREKMEKLGIEVYFDTCMVVSNLKDFASKKIVTDSAKAAYYLASQGYKVRLVSRMDALKIACGDFREN
ncbi:MAG: hypothetical protein DRJ35_03345 [Thermoprotei archaeon]|nr:MAG: hypothetical protein DRJ35_03345 [Thermoprotei archaeon]